MRTHRSPGWIRLLCAVLLAATLLNYANRFVFTQNSSRIVEELFDGEEAPYGRLAGWFGLGFACGGLLFGALVVFCEVDQGNRLGTELVFKLEVS